jgi:hypothetical protein
VRINFPAAPAALILTVVLFGVLFGGCNSDRPQPVTAPPTGGDIQTPPDAPPPRLLLFAQEETRAGVEAVLNTRDMQAALATHPGYLPDIHRAFAIAGYERGHDTQVTFVPMRSEGNPDELILVVHARAGNTVGVHAAVVRRSPPETPGRFQRYGELWISLASDGLDPGVARWTGQQQTDFWHCIIERSATNVVSCAIGCVFTAGGWLPCVVTCSSIGELTTIAGCAARVLINQYRGRYDPKEATP